MLSCCYSLRNAMKAPLLDDYSSCLSWLRRTSRTSLKSFMAMSCSAEVPVTDIEPTEAPFKLFYCKISRERGWPPFLRIKSASPSEFYGCPLRLLITLSSFKLYLPLSQFCTLLESSMSYLLWKMACLGFCSPLCENTWYSTSLAAPSDNFQLWDGLLVALARSLFLSVLVC